MKNNTWPKLLNGDIANLSIGQAYPGYASADGAGDVDRGQRRHLLPDATRPAGAINRWRDRYGFIMCARKKTLNFSSETMAQLRTGMVDAVNAPAGTAHAASRRP